MAALGLMIASGISPAMAQQSTPSVVTDRPTIAVTGSGEASGEAVSAIMQFIVRQGFPINAEATVTDADAAGKGAGGPFGPQVTPLTKRDVAPVISALVDAGVAKASIETVISEGPFGGAFGPGSAVIVVELDATTLPKRADLSNAAYAAGTNSGLSFDAINLAFNVADCGAIQGEAIKDAIANGEGQATSVAAALGTTLGDLIQTTLQPSYNGYYAPYGAGGGSAGDVCAQLPTVEIARHSYLPTFDPNGEAELELYAQVSLIYAIGS